MSGKLYKKNGEEVAETQISFEVEQPEADGLKSWSGSFPIEGASVTTLMGNELLLKLADGRSGSLWVRK